MKTVTIKRLEILALTLLLLLMTPLYACDVPQPPTPVDTPITYTGINHQVLEAYHATFLLRFEGDYDWLYRLDTRTNGQALEYVLHLEGVNTSQNPGDVRLVSQDDVNRMRGPGTDDECVQFPREINLGFSFISPDELIPPEVISQSLTEVTEEMIAGREATHYTLANPDLLPWRDGQINLWRDEVSGAVLRYDLQVYGSDPLFDAGEGQLSGRLLVNEIGAQQIEPISGCTIDLPLPSDASSLVRLPGLIAFRTAKPSAEIIDFYQSNLPEAGWDAIEGSQVEDDATLPGYQKDDQILYINIEQDDRGVSVELLLDQR